MEVGKYYKVLTYASNPYMTPEYNSVGIILLVQL